MKNSNSKTKHNLSESLKGLSDIRYFRTGRKKYVSRQERIKEVPRIQEALSLIHHDNIVSDELFVGETSHHDDDIWGENIWVEEKEEEEGEEEEEEEKEESDSDISEMSTERILMNDNLDYEEQDTVAEKIDEKKENEDDDGFDFKSLLNAIIFRSSMKSNKSIN
jgi:hypothetical protein